MIQGDSRPIGVFDSGVGGLTVLKELALQFPGENFIYLGDTARLPYGSKSPGTIRRYCEQNIEFLKKQNVKAIVIACNSASTQVSETEVAGTPVYNVIGPGAARALHMSQSLRIGVLGTRATINSGAYEKALRNLEPKVQVFNQACPLFVPLAEEGWDSDPVTNLIVFRYLSQLLPHHIDVLILGCTHYPILKNSIARVTGSSIELVDSGESVAVWLSQDMQQSRVLPRLESDPRFIHVLTTDFSEHFNEVAQKIIKPLKADEFHVVDL